MSFDSHELLGMFTQDELDAGIDSLVFGANDGEELRDSAERRQVWDEAKLADASKLVAGIRSQNLIRRKLFRKLIRDEVAYLILRYARKEELPNEYVRVVQQPDCLEVLIKGFLRKIGGFELTDDLVAEISRLVSELYVNDNLDIVYDRVQWIQAFIHEKIDLRHGPSAHMKLPAKAMKHLLSTSRLHLNVHEVRFRDYSYLVSIAEKSKRVSDNEYLNPQPYALAMGKRPTVHWRVRHMKAFNYFLKRETRVRLGELIALPDCLPIEEFRDKAIEIYGKNASYLEGYGWA